LKRPRFMRCGYRQKQILVSITPRMYLCLYVLVTCVVDPTAENILWAKRPQCWCDVKGVEEKLVIFSFTAKIPRALPNHKISRIFMLVYV